MRYGIAVVSAGVGIATAAALGSLPLNPHGRLFINVGGVNGVNGGQFTWVAARPTWQTPVAILIAVLGIGVAGVVAYRRGSGVPNASN